MHTAIVPNSNEDKQDRTVINRFRIPIHLAHHQE